MKKLLSLSLASFLVGSMGTAFAAFESEYETGRYSDEVKELDVQREEDVDQDEVADYSTRTLNARHALTTGNPEYADDELDDDEKEEFIDSWENKEGLE